MRIVTAGPSDAILLAESEAAIERIRAAIDLKHIEGHRFTVGGQPLEQGSSTVSGLGVIVIAVGPDFSQIGAHCVSGV